MEFAGFDDDLFEEKPARGCVAQDYQARVCEPGWFMQLQPGQLVSQEDEFGAKKFAADYLFLSKSYDAAAAKYENILNNLPDSNTTSKRECQENLARCHIKLGIPNKALMYAEELHSSSRTCDQFTVSYSVVLDAHLAAGRHSDALKAAQSLVSAHPDNGHLWMKLAYVYALLGKISLPNVRSLIHAYLPVPVKNTRCDDPEVAAQGTELKNNPSDSSYCFHEGELLQAHEGEEQKIPQKSVMIVCACLQRAYYILVKTEGTAVGFAVAQTKTLKEKLLEDIQFLLDDCLLGELRKNIYQNDKVESGQCVSEADTNSEGNMKGKSNDENREVGVPQEMFEEKWFKWIL